jgi:eukaryotic-like serine/threonine-protein kinase
MPADVSTLLGGRYELQDRVGAGGFSEVWRAHDQVLERAVAIKLLDDKYARDPEALARFHSEAHNAGCLSHPNIARIYDFGEPDPPHPAFLVMELVDGPALADVLDAGPIEPARCMDIIAQAASGLHEAHLHGLVHRDVKPGNLLLAPDGVKVADFGISHAVDSAALTMTGIVIGSPGYVAPERASGASATPSSDLYALGVVAYECLTGMPPFAGTGLEVALAHVNQPFPALPEYVPAGVAAFVEQLTSKDPALRPPDAAAAAELACQLRDQLMPAPAPVRGPAPAPGEDSAAAGFGSERLSASEWWSSVARPARSSPVPRSRVPRSLPRVNVAGRRLVLAGAATACLALSLVLAGVLYSASAPSVASARHAQARQAHQASIADQLNPAAAKVTAAHVHSRSLVGQPVALVVRQLRELGLRTQVIWRPTSVELPGTVVAVYPGGKRPAGSLITIVGARQRQISGPPAHRHPAPHGPGDGPGKGHGQGSDKGPGKSHGPDHGGQADGNDNSGDGSSQGDG